MNPRARALLTLSISVLALASPTAAQYGAIPPRVVMRPAPTIKPLEMPPPPRLHQTPPSQFISCGASSASCTGTTSTASETTARTAALPSSSRTLYAEVGAGFTTRAERWAANVGGMRDYFVRSSR